VIAFNTEIAAAVQDVQRTRGTAVALVDVFTALDAAAAAGLDVEILKTGWPRFAEEWRQFVWRRCRYGG